MASLSLIFSLFAVLSTYTGVPVDGSLVNVRITAILSGGILFGPWVGIVAGVVSGVHRYLIDMQGYTSEPCLISSTVAGLLGTLIHYRISGRHLWWCGILAGMVCEGLTMGLILLLTPPGIGSAIVGQIAFPMIGGTVCVGLIIRLVQDLNDERELLAARQAKLALTIANQTLPYFQDMDPDAMAKVCGIIRNELDADAVAITNTTDVLAYVGTGKDYYEREGHGAISSLTRQAVENDQIILENDLQQYHLPNLHSVIIIPLRERGKTCGTLKLFYHDTYSITSPLKELAVGLSQLISTQLEVSRVKQLEGMARKAEFTALQSRINPHFLFNALNAISTLIRIRPAQARQLISNLADYLRYNLSLDDGMIDIQDELQQVRDYVAIEQARFGSKLKVVFDVDEVHLQVPSLLLQPLVENAIIHGIQPRNGPGEVCIMVKQTGDVVHVCIRDTGYGISPEVMEGIRRGRVESRSIGLSNVNERLKLLYGAGLQLTRLEPGTAVCFDLPFTVGAAC